MLKKLWNWLKKNLKADKRLKLYSGPALKAGPFLLKNRILQMGYQV